MIASYWGVGFWEFWSRFGGRLWEGFPGGLGADEVQLFTLGCSAISCGLLGPFLLVRRMGMLANSLSHTILLGVVAAFVIGSQLWGASVSDLPVLLVGACAAALLTAGANGALCRWFRLSEEASVGLVFTALFSLGLVAVALYTKNVHLGVEAVLGNADALRPADVWLASGVAAVGIALSALFYPRLLASSFDATLCRLLSIRTGPVEWGLLFMTALTCIAAFRSVGVVVVLSLLTGPYLISRLFFDRLSRLLIAAPLVGIGVSALAVSLNRAFLTHTGIALSTGGLLATMLGALFALSLICRRAGKKLHF